MVHKTTPCMAFAKVSQLNLTNVFKGKFEPSKIGKGMCNLQNWSWGG
jgi:hypothetical protein